GVHSASDAPQIQGALRAWCDLGGWMIQFVEKRCVEKCSAAAVGDCVMCREHCVEHERIGFIFRTPGDQNQFPRRSMLDVRPASILLVFKQAAHASIASGRSFFWVPHKLKMAIEANGWQLHKPRFGGILARDTNTQGWNREHNVDNSLLEYFTNFSTSKLG